MKKHTTQSDTDFNNYLNQAMVFRPTSQQLDALAMSIERGKRLIKPATRPLYPKIPTIEQHQEQALQQYIPSPADQLRMLNDMRNAYMPQPSYTEHFIPIPHKPHFSLSKPRTTPTEWFAYLSAAIAITACLAYVYQFVVSIL